MEQARSGIYTNCCSCTPHVHCGEHTAVYGHRWRGMSIYARTSCRISYVGQSAVQCPRHPHCCTSKAYLTFIREQPELEACSPTSTWRQSGSLLACLPGSAQSALIESCNCISAVRHAIHAGMLAFAMACNAITPLVQSCSPRPIAPASTTLSFGSRAHFPWIIKTSLDYFSVCFGEWAER